MMKRSHFLDSMYLAIHFVRGEVSFSIYCRCSSREAGAYALRACEANGWDLPHGGEGV